MDAGLIVHPSAANQASAYGELLGIGYANGKQFFKRCTSFRCSKASRRRPNGIRSGAVSRWSGQDRRRQSMRTVKWHRQMWRHRNGPKILLTNTDSRSRRA